MEISGLRNLRILLLVKLIIPKGLTYRRVVGRLGTSDDISLRFFLET